MHGRGRRWPSSRLPTIFQDQGLSEGEAAGLYSIYTFLALPMALIAPIIGFSMGIGYAVGPFLCGVVSNVTAWASPPSCPLVATDDSKVRGLHAPGVIRTAGDPRPERE